MTTPREHIVRRCFINAPLLRLQEGLLDTFLAHGLQPEIGLASAALRQVSRHDCVRISTALRRHKLACTLHAPFFDLAPGAEDPGVLAASRDVLQAAFDLLPVFQPRAIVCHLGYDDKHHRGRQRQWLENSLVTWHSLVARAAEHGVPVHFENTYEHGPQQHLLLFQSLEGNTGFCLDVGHAIAFSRLSPTDWLETLHPWLRHLHLHDNDGSGDDHQAIGSGKVNFPLLAVSLHRYGLRPLVTLEPHSEQDLWDSLAALERPELAGLLPHDTADNLSAPPAETNIAGRETGACRC